MYQGDLVTGLARIFLRLAMHPCYHHISNKTDVFRDDSNLLSRSDLSVPDCKQCNCRFALLFHYALIN